MKKDTLLEDIKKVVYGNGDSDGNSAKIDHVKDNPNDESRQKPDIEHVKLDDNQARKEYGQDFNLVMSVTEVAQLYDISYDKILRWCNEGILLAEKPDGSRSWLISTRYVILKMGYP